MKYFKKGITWLLVAVVALGMLAFLLPAFSATQVVQQPAPTIATSTSNQQPGIITNITAEPATTQPLAPAQ
jgi:cytoskeletal protein RodZ